MKKTAKFKTIMLTVLYKMSRISINGSGLYPRMCVPLYPRMYIKPLPKMVLHVGARAYGQNCAQKVKK